MANLNAIKMYLVLKDWAQERFDTGAGLLKQYV